MKNYPITNSADTHFFQTIHAYLKGRSDLIEVEEIVDVDGAGVVRYVLGNKELYLVQELLLDQVIVQSEHDISDIVGNIRDYLANNDINV
ncbi:MAG: hypothetical protein ACOX0R_03255 [Candidatus Dojkabacteria bacterium]|jgi:hypothetical protein